MNKTTAEVAAPKKRFGLFAARPAEDPEIRHKPLRQRLAENWQLYLLLLVPVIITIVYKYGPMYGIQIAFRDFKPSRGITGSEWVGLYWFKRFFESPNCVRMIKNTVLLSLYSLLWSLNNSHPATISKEMFDAVQKTCKQ